MAKPKNDGFRIKKLWLKITCLSFFVVSQWALLIQNAYARIEQGNEGVLNGSGRSFNTQGNSIIDSLSSVMIGMVIAGSLFRLVICFIRMGTDDEQKTMYIRRARHAIMFLVFTLCVWGLKDMVLKYYNK